MHSDADTVEEYLSALPDERRTPMVAVRDAVNASLPEGYVESMAGGMVTWAVPLEDYPNTYNGQPLTVAALASQKKHMSLYLMGVYASETDREWLEQQHAERGLRLDMGRSCLRFRRLDDLDLDVVGQAVARIPPALFIERYEAARTRTRPRR